MKALTFKIQFCFITAIAIIMAQPIRGQESNTIYYMKGVPQSYIVNPATQPRCNGFLGLPSSSPMQFHLENSGFSFGDVIYPMGDSLITFLHRNGDKDKFLNTLSPMNYTNAFLSTNLFSLGYRSGDYYYTFDFSEKVYANVSYTDDLISFVLKGNRRGDRFDFSGTGVNLLSYFEYATGVSKVVNQRLSFGSRFKVLFGHANISMKSKDVTLLTEEDWTMKSNMTVSLNIPGLLIPIDENGKFVIDSVHFDESFDPVDAVQSAFGNPGLGLDLGIHYLLYDRVTFSASLIDLAFIRWNSNPYNIKQNASFVYQGIEVDPNDTVDQAEKFLDSLSSVFSFIADDNTYYAMLPLKLYAGFNYAPVKQISIGILSKTEYFNRKFREQLTLSANFSPFNWLAATISYSIMNNTYYNLGCGLAAKLGPFSFYFLTDNMPVHYIIDEKNNYWIPDEARTLNFRLGFNLVFGCNKEKKVFKDLPLVY